MDHEDVRKWVASYEKAWRTPGTTLLPGLFTDDASYRPSPWAPAIAGVEAVAEFWDAGRRGAEEVFTMRSQVVAVDENTAVVRVEVDYEHGNGTRWRDLWVLRFATDGRCSEFEEWPFSPEQPDGH